MSNIDRTPAAALADMAQRNRDLVYLADASPRSLAYAAHVDALLADVDRLETHAERLGARSARRASLAFWAGTLVGASSGLLVALVVRFVL